jgi:hypothetical protein
MSISAMKQALEALEGLWDDGFGGVPESMHKDAITALRQAIEEVEKQGLEHSIEVRCFGPHISFITREPMSQYKDGDCFYRIKKEKNT